MNWVDRRKLKRAYVHLLAQQKPQVFLTLATNSMISEADMKRKLKAFFAHLDAAYLGRHWHRKSKDKRVAGFYALEKVGINTHAHCFVTFHQGNKIGQKMLTDEIWSKLCPSGTIDFQPISDAKGAINYSLKEMECAIHLSNSIGDNIGFVEDFHSKQ